MKPLAHLVIFFLAGLFVASGEVPTSPMVAIKGGVYERPLEKGGKTRNVADFQIDVRQVTNAEFLVFVEKNPQWQRSRVNRLFADEGYLAKWKSDDELGPLAPPNAPVVGVSWFAARAYLKSVDKRLPTVDEWEFVARADENSPDASKTPEFKEKILSWYAKPTPKVLPSVESQTPNYHGVSGLHGVVWEWTADFVSAMTSGEARSDGTLSPQDFCGGGGADPLQATEYASFMRMAFRSSLKGSFCLSGLGFRGAKDAANPTKP